MRSRISDGTYSISGLSAGTYDVCFSGAYASGSSTTGYGNQCYNGVTWDGIDVRSLAERRQCT